MCRLLQEGHRACYVKLSGATVVPRTCCVIIRLFHYFWNLLQEIKEEKSLLQLTLGRIVVFLYMLFTIEAEQTLTSTYRKIIPSGKSSKYYPFLLDIPKVLLQNNFYQIKVRHLLSFFANNGLEVQQTLASKYRELIGLCQFLKYILLLRDILDFSDKHQKVHFSSCHFYQKKMQRNIGTKCKDL